MPPRTAFFFDELCLWHSAGQHAQILPVGGWVQPPSGGGHAESPDSKRRLKSLMDVSGLSARLQVRSAPPLDEDDLLRVHTPAYLQRFQALSDAGGGILGQQAPIGPGSYEIAKLSAGLCWAAVDVLLCGEADKSYALSRPPGHHCLADAAMGFCFLANAALAAELAIARHGLRRVAIVDWDVHHGNGSQSIFYRRGDVLTISLHQDGCYPPGYGGADDHGEGEGLGANLNIPLLPGGGHQAYLDAMRLLVLPALRRFQPELIIVACGYDANALDPLARMQAHSDTFRALTTQLVEYADAAAGGHLAMLHEGGYSEAYVPFCGLAALEALSGVRTPVEDPLLELVVAQQPGAAMRDLQTRQLQAQAERHGL